MCFNDSKNLRLWQKVLLTGIPAAVGVVLLFGSIYIFKILGIALCIGGLYSLLPELNRIYKNLCEHPPSLRGHRLAWLGPSLPYVTLFLVSAGLLWPCILGEMPKSQDHTVHLTRAWHFVTQMLKHGHLSGWSDLWFAGWPAGEDYPPGGDYWISAFYLGTFGLLGWEASYAVAFLCFYAVSGFAIYSFGKKYLGRPAGLLAALFFLLDRGYYREGGWNYTVWWGVWPQILCLAFIFFSFSRLDEVVKRGSAKDYLLGAFCIGYAILCHPVSVVYFGLALPIYLAARLLSTEEKRGLVLARVLGVFALGGMLAAYWVLPYTAKGSWMVKIGELWKSLPELAQGLIQGNIFTNVTPPLVWLGLLGAAVAAWRRSYPGIFLFGLAASLLFISSSTAFEKLHLAEISPAFNQIQFQRLPIISKTCLFLLGGYALQVFFAHHQKWHFQWKRYALALLLAFAVAPFVEPVLQSWGKTYGAELGRMTRSKDFPQWQDYQEFLAWSKDLKKKEPEFFRIAYVGPYNNHFFAAAPVYNGIPAYKVGYTPCTTFKNKPDLGDPELYRVLSVKYVVANGYPGQGNLKLVKRFGSITVHQNLGYSPKRYTLEGPGRVEVLRFDREQMKMRVSGASKHSKLIIHRANYANWQASVDGETLPIKTTALGAHEHFIGVAAKNGVIDVRYTWPAVNIFASLASWLAVGILIFIIACRFSPKLKEKASHRLGPIGQWLEHHGAWIAIGLVVLLPCLMLIKSSAAKDPTPQGSLLKKIKSASVELVKSSGSERCPWQKDRFQCSTGGWNYVGEVFFKIDAQYRRCIWAHPTNDAKLVIRIPDVKLGRELTGHHGLLDDAINNFPTGAPVTMTIAIDDKVVKTLVRPNIRGWAHFRIDTSSKAGQRSTLTFTVSTTNAGGRHYCFSAEIEP